MSPILVPLAGARVPTDVAPDPTFTVGSLIALLAVGAIFVGGVLTLVLVLVRRNRKSRQDTPGSGTPNGG